MRLGALLGTSLLCIPLTLVLACVGDEPVAANPAPFGGTDAGEAGPPPAADGGAEAAVPGTTIQVTPEGNDNADGYLKPVKTLKRALGIAKSGDTVKLAAGRYDASSGETFPAKVPDGVTVMGLAGGGSILGGTRAEPAIVLGSGSIQDLEIDSFKVGIQVSGTASLKGLRIRKSVTAIAAEGAAKVTAQDVDITGNLTSCDAGVALSGDADFAVQGLATRSLGTTLSAEANAAATVTKSRWEGDPGCTDPVLAFATKKRVALSETVLDGGRAGVAFGTPGTVPGAFDFAKSSAVRNMTGNALVGGNVTATLNDVELSMNGRMGIEANSGAWDLKSVSIKQNAVAGIYLQGASAIVKGKLVMRSSTVTQNGGDGIYLFDNTQGDLGTGASAGGNTIAGNTGAGINVAGFTGATTISAVGNTWRPSVQSANAVGRYVGGVSANGPVPRVAGNNYAITAGWSLDL